MTLHPKQIEDIFKFYSKNYSTYKISDILGISKYAVRKYLLSQGIPIRPSQPKIPKTEEDKRKISEYLKEGKKIKQIAFLYNVSYTTMYEYIKRNSLK